MAFRFRGEKILEWRRAVAERARGEYVRAAESAREAARLAGEADARVAAASHAAAAALRDAVDIHTIERHRIWIVSEERRAAECHRAHQERQKIVEDKAAALRIASRHVRVVERLRERAERRYRDDERRRELKALDELATAQYARRRMDEGVERGGRPDISDFSR